MKNSALRISVTSLMLLCVVCIESNWLTARRIPCKDALLTVCKTASLLTATVFVLSALARRALSNPSLGALLTGHLLCLAVGDFVYTSGLGLPRYPHNLPGDVAFGLSFAALATSLVMMGTQDHLPKGGWYLALSVAAASLFVQWRLLLSPMRASDALPTVAAAGVYLYSVSVALVTGFALASLCITHRKLDRTYLGLIMLYASFDFASRYEPTVTAINSVNWSSLGWSACVIGMPIFFVASSRKSRACTLTLRRSGGEEFRLVAGGSVAAGAATLIALQLTFSIIQVHDTTQVAIMSLGICASFFIADKFAAKASHAALYRSSAESNEMFYQLAHDMRAPLRALNVIHGTLPSNCAQSLLFRQTTDRLAGMLNGILESRRGQSVDATCNIADVAEHIVKEKQAELVARSGALRLDSGLRPTDAAPISGMELGRVLSNLISNAFEASDVGSPVTVELCTTRDFYRISVRDQGHGMSPDLLRKVRKGLGTFGKANGNGLGIKGALKVIHKVGGHLDIQSKSGVGTTVFLHIPKNK